MSKDMIEIVMPEVITDFVPIEECHTDKEVVSQARVKKDKMRFATQKQLKKVEQDIDKLKKMIELAIADATAIEHLAHASGNQSDSIISLEEKVQSLTHELSRKMTATAKCFDTIHAMMDSLHIRTFMLLGVVMFVFVLDIFLCRFK